MRFPVIDQSFLQGIIKERELKNMTNMAGNKTMMNLQDSFLNHVRKENLPVVIYLVNGFQIRGQVRGFGAGNSCAFTRSLKSSSRTCTDLFKKPK